VTHALVRINDLFLSASNEEECVESFGSINEFPRSNFVADERGSLLSDFRHNLNVWELFGIHMVDDVRQTDIHIYS
jgi:hypothetical protein